MNIVKNIREKKCIIFKTMKYVYYFIRIINYMNNKILKIIVVKIKLITNTVMYVD